MNRKALVLLSGGQDSTTCLFWAKKNFDHVEAIGFNYGQRHKKELQCALEITKNAYIKYYIVNINTLDEISQNALTNKNIDIRNSQKEGVPPNTLVEGRNLLFLTYAGIYAKTQDISNIVMGVSQTDYSNYPDCRNEFIISAQETLCLATNYQFKLHVPLMWKSKAETWALADKLGVLEYIRDNTITCYNGIIGQGCGECPACILRRKGLDLYLNEK